MTFTSDSSKKIFIVGVGRSGTSLLQAMLGSHPDITFLPETGFARRYLFSGKFDKIYSISGRQGVEQLLKLDTRFSRLPDETLNKIVSLNKEGSDHDTNQLLDLTVYEVMHASDAHPYTGDKDPRLVEHINILLKLWPDAKIIHLYRDPRDVAVSKKKAAWSKGKSTFTQVLATCAQFQMGDRALANHGATNVYSLKYESLVVSPEKELDDVCDWLELKFVKSMLNFSSSAKSLVFDDERQWKSEVLGPLLPGNFDKWRNVLSDREIRLIEFSCNRAMKKGNYQSAELPNGWRTFSASLGGLMIRALGELYILYRTVHNYLIYREHFGKRNTKKY